MKKLYVLIKDLEDGSYYPRYTFNEDWIKSMESNDDLDYDAVGCDGDGFHYDTIMVPSEATLAMLGITSDCAEY
jgi:hypothetical protein